MENLNVKKKPTRCGNCKAKVGLTGLECKWCQSDSKFCSNCIQLEKHNCAGIKNKISCGLENISRSNPLVEAKKLEAI